MDALRALEVMRGNALENRVSEALARQVGNNDVSPAGSCNKWKRHGDNTGQKKQLSTTMLSTSTNVQFPGHNHLLTTGTDYPLL